MNLVLWLSAAGALAACEVAGRVLDHGWPTAAGILRTVRGHLGGRVAVVLVWLWLGWHVFAR